MKVFAKTDIGKAREMNQDYYAIPKSEEDVAVYILADGMGGYKGGEIASSLATNSAKSYIINNFQSAKQDKESILLLIKNAIEYANMVVYEKSKETQEFENMGTTLEVCLIYNNRVYIGHVGDSRVYRIRKQFMRKLTVDHSYVEDLVKDGKITRQQAMNHPKKNMITRALGCNSYVEPDLIIKGFLKEDVLLICSDGLTNMLSEEEIFQTITKDVENSAEKLVEQANNLGGYDNISVIVIQNS